MNRHRMSQWDWLSCEEPDLLLEELEGDVSRTQLVEFVRRCWERITPYLPPTRSSVTVVEQFAALAPEQSDHNAVVYAAEADLKAARLAPDFQDEQTQQANLLRRIVSRPRGAAALPRTESGRPTVRSGVRHFTTET